jgi:hypothetical protein
MITMDVKSEKTFEEIVERLAALFGPKTRPGDQDYVASIEFHSHPSREPRSPADSPKKKK